MLGVSSKLEFRLRSTCRSVPTAASKLQLRRAVGYTSAQPIHGDVAKEALHHVQPGLPSRFKAARHAAVQLLEPKVVHVPLPKRMLKDEAELKAWLVDVEQLVTEKLVHGTVTQQTEP